MLRLLNKLRRDERGNVLLVMAAALPILVGAAGLATDTIQWALWKRQLQRAADSAAIAGVYERIRAGNTDGVATAVTTDLSINQKTGIALYAPAQITFPTGGPSGANNQVRVVLKVQKPLTFSSMFMANAPIIETSATAAGVSGTAGEFCVIGLDRRSTVTGIDIQGSTTLDMEKCSLMANSTNPTDAFTNTGNGSTVKAKRMAASGGVRYSAQWTVEGYDPYSPPIEDPFKDLPMPSTCTKTIEISDKQKDYPIDRSSQDTAGQIVCISGGLDIKGSLTLGPATYVLNDGGSMVMNSSTSGVGVSCVGCSVLLTNTANPSTLR